jgi:hypothetical protein
MTVFRKKRGRMRIIWGLPFLVLLVFCHALGELAGYISGPGNSPHMAR